MSLQSKIEKNIGVDNQNEKGLLIKSTKTLRTLIGVLGVLLPILLVLFSDNCTNKPLESISHYYYTNSGTLFSVVLSLLGVFLILYIKDFILSTVAGVFGICVAFFPTSWLDDTCCIVNLADDNLRIGFHYFSAAVFLFILGYMSFFHFTKLDEEEKAIDVKNVSYSKLYRICGLFIFLSIAIIGLRALGNVKFLEEALEAFSKFYDDWNLTFWFEVIALESFGIAWLIRGISMPSKKQINKYKMSQ